MQTGHSADAAPPPIFLFGVLERSGTNFLSDLLCLHPACGPAHPLDEDFLHFRAELLERYARGTITKWHPDWGLSDGGADDLLVALGRGLLDFLRATAGATDGTGSVSPHRLVTKTPSVKNLSLFPRLFPGTPAIVLMRDGRSVVESGVRSFGFTYEEQTRKWAWAAREIARTVGTSRSVAPFDAGAPFLLVRYEDLVMDAEPELRRIFAFTGLDAGAYDFASVDTLPVRGSSTFRGTGDEVTWQPVERSDSFNPLQRWRNWSRARHDRFNWLGGSELAAFGYAPVGPAGGPAHHVRNRLLDVRWRVWPARRRSDKRRAGSSHEEAMEAADHV
jgi:hypothetical protein